jgi:hypothetical protein
MCLLYLVTQEPPNPGVSQFDKLQLYVIIAYYNAADGQKPFLMSQLDQIKNQPQPSN